MSFVEKSKTKTNKTYKPHELCNGPSKLCMSMGIDKTSCNKIDLCNSDKMWIENDLNFNSNFNIVRSTRIGIQSSGEEWASKLLRFYILGNAYVSKRDKKAEAKFS